MGRHNIRLATMGSFDRRPIPSSERRCGVSEPTKRPWTTGGIFYPDSPRPTCNIWGARVQPDHQSGDLVARALTLPDAELVCEAVNQHDELIRQRDALLFAARLACLNFTRVSASSGGRFLGDDDQESWSALSSAIALCENPNARKMPENQTRQPRQQAVIDGVTHDLEYT